MNQHQVNRAFDEAFKQIEQEFSGLGPTQWREQKEHERNAFIVKRQQEILRQMGHSFEVSYHRFYGVFIAWKKNKAFDSPGIDPSKAVVMPIDKFKNKLS